KLRLPAAAVIADLQRVALERGVARISEGAQHSGYVGQRGVLEAALRERASRLSLEVHDDEIVALQEHLPEMIVTVASGLQALRHGGRAALDALQQGPGSREQRLRVRGNGRGKLR